MCASGMNEGRSSMNTVYIHLPLQYVNCECGSTRNYNSEMIISYDGNGWLHWWRQIEKLATHTVKSKKGIPQNGAPFTARPNIHCSYNNCKLPVITNYFFSFVDVSVPTDAFYDLVCSITVVTRFVCFFFLSNSTLCTIKDA